MYKANKVGMKTYIKERYYARYKITGDMTVNLWESVDTFRRRSKRVWLLH